MMRWQVQEMDKLQSLVVNTCDLFIPLTVAAVTSGGMVVKMCVVCLMVTTKKNEKCMCVCVCVCVCAFHSVCACVCE